MGVMYCDCNHHTIIIIIDKLQEGNKYFIMKSKRLKEIMGDEQHLVT